MKKKWATVIRKSQQYCKNSWSSGASSLTSVWSSSSRWLCSMAWTRWSCTPWYSAALESDQEGDPVQRMVFILQGKPRSMQPLTKSMVPACVLIFGRKKWISAEFRPSRPGAKSIFRPKLLKFGKFWSNLSQIAVKIWSNFSRNFWKWPKFGHLGLGRKKAQTENQNTAARSRAGSAAGRRWLPRPAWTAGSSFVRRRRSAPAPRAPSRPANARRRAPRAPPPPTTATRPATVRVVNRSVGRSALLHPCTSKPSLISFVQQNAAAAGRRRWKLGEVQPGRWKRVTLSTGLTGTSLG